MKLVAFAGPKQIGKSTASSELGKMVKDHVRISFAGPLKLALRSMGFTHDELVYHKETIIPEIGKTPRVLMQTLGTDWGRNMIHKDIWLILFARQYNQQVKNGTELLTVDDVRYDNEAECIRQLGGQIVKIKSLAKPYEKPDLHSSEQGTSDHLVNHVIYNDGSLAEYLVHVRNFGLQLFNKI